MPEIFVKQGSRVFRLTWEIVHQDKRCRRYKVWPTNNPDKYIVVENNEPLIRGQLKLKHRRIDWKQVEGRDISNGSLEMIIKEITDPTPQFTKPTPTLYGRSKKSNGDDASLKTLGDRASNLK